MLVYLCAFHIIENLKFLIFSKVPELGNLCTLVYNAMHVFYILLLITKRQSLTSSSMQEKVGHNFNYFFFSLFYLMVIISYA